MGINNADEIIRYLFVELNNLNFGLNNLNKIWTNEKQQNGAIAVVIEYNDNFVWVKMMIEE